MVFQKNKPRSNCKWCSECDLSRFWYLANRWSPIRGGNWRSRFWRVKFRSCFLLPGPCFVVSYLKKNGPDLRFGCSFYDIHVFFDVVFLLRICFVLWHSWAAKHGFTNKSHRSNKWTPQKIPTIKIWKNMGKIIHIHIPICEPPYIFITSLHKLHKLPESTCSLLQALCTLNPLRIDASTGYLETKAKPQTCCLSAHQFPRPNKNFPLESMYGIFAYICLIFVANVGKYTVHGSNGFEMTSQDSRL